MSEGLFFPQQTSGASGGVVDSQFVKDSFRDYSKPADDNTNLTSTALTNPSSNFFGNDLSAKYSIKTLWIKDIVLEENRSKWPQGGKSYRVIFTEDFPGIYAYAIGSVNVTTEINGNAIALQEPATKFGVTGQILKASFLVKPNTSSPAGGSGQADYYRDGSLASVGASTYIGVADENGANSTQPNFVQDQRKYFIVDIAATQTSNIHDFHITVNTASSPIVNPVEVIGVIVYLSTDSSNVQVRPGRTFIDKALVTTSAGSTLTLPAQNASLFHLGAKSTFFENSAGVVGVTTLPVSLLQTQATGLSGTNLVAVSVGTGASYPIGTGFNVQTGTSLYLGIVQSLSTDTLTVSPTLPYAMTGATMTKSFFVPQTGFNSLTTSISMAIYDLAYSWDPMATFGASNWNGVTSVHFINGPSVPLGFSSVPYSTYYDPENRFAVMPITGISAIQGRIRFQMSYLNGWYGPLKIKGDFQAIEFEVAMAQGNGALNTTTSTIDGVTMYASGLSITPSSTGSYYFRIPMAVDLGIGFHTLKFTPGMTLTGFAEAIITKVNFYKYKGVSIAGKLHSIEQIQTQYDVASTGDTPIGAYKFFGSDKLSYTGPWFKQYQNVAATMTSFPGFAQCVSGATTNAVLLFKYWGKNFTLFTDSAGGSYSTTLDGIAITPTSAVQFTVATEMLHTLVLTNASGTFGIQGIAILKDYNELKNEQLFSVSDDAVDGNDILDNTIQVDKARVREIGGTIAIGGVALGGAVDIASGFTTSLISLGGQIFLKTSGNPVLLGLNTSFYTPGSTTAGIFINGSATAGCFLDVFLCRFPYGSTIGLRTDSSEITGLFGCVAQFRFGERIGTTTGFIFTSSFQYPCGSINHLDLPPAGIWNYRLFGLISGAGTTIQITNSKLYAMEMF